MNLTLTDIDILVLSKAKKNLDPFTKVRCQLCL